MRPNFITQEDITRWDETIDSDEDMPKGFADNPTQREVCYAGLWLYEQLMELDCPEVDAFQMQYTAGALSVTNDPWEVHQKTLEIYSGLVQDLCDDLIESVDLN